MKSSNTEFEEYQDSLGVSKMGCNFCAREKYAKWGRRGILKLDQCENCGDSGFLVTFPDKFINKGTDIDPVAVNHTIEQFGFKCYCGEFTDIKFDEGSFDVIMFRGVLEHVVDPKNTLCVARNLISERGLLYITATPDLHSICAEIYRGMWKQVCPEHLYYFSVEHLENVLRS